MNFFDGIILGIVQGLTEFFPVSSSGHLILARDILGIHTENSLAFDAVLQLATSFAILFCFKKEFFKLCGDFLSFFKKNNSEDNANINTQNYSWFVPIILGTLPIVILGLVFENIIGTVLRNDNVVVLALLAGSLLFILAEWFAKQDKELNAKKGFWVGVFQTLALIPGISRSGATISGGLLFGMKREEATRFSFMLGFPILFGSGILKLFELGLNGTSSREWLVILISSLMAFIAGALSINFLVKFLKTHTLHIFAIYRILLAIIVFIILS